MGEINTEFRLAMNGILLAYALIDSQGAQVVKPFLDDAVERLLHAERLCVAASRTVTAPQALLLLLDEGE